LVIYARIGTTTAPRSTGGVVQKPRVQAVAAAFGY
jgi:hypothetical protein